jgi:type VI secretion system protein ImpJ
MRLLSSVVWSEGMYLAPQHFQAQNRHFEDNLRTVAEWLCFRPYGWSGFALEPEALRNGTVVLLHARGIMEDGLCFNAPDSDALPSPLTLTDRLPAATDRATIYLAIPTRRERGANCALDDATSDACRHIAEERPVVDENTGAGERAVVVGRRNLGLFAGDAPPPDRVALPIARVIRDGAGGFRQDPDFIPPLLQISADEGLMLRLRRLIEILDAKSAALSPRGEAAAEFSTREIASFWLLHAIHSGLGVLRHLWTSKRGRPEELFLAMSRLGGALCTFAPESHPRSLPAYDHDDLSSCFAALDRHIRDHLEAALPTSCLSIPLRPTAPYIYEGEVTDARALERSDWILGIRAKLDQSALIRLPPQLVKVCSARFVAELVKRALPGLSLRHLPSPPRSVPRRIETQYFGISRIGPAWEDIVKTRRVGVYIPGEFTEVELELLVSTAAEGLR